MEDRQRFEEGRKQHGYAGYMAERYKELVEKGEREEFNPEIKGMAGTPDLEFVEGHPFNCLLDYHKETEGRTLLDYRKQAWSCIICRVCNRVTCFHQTSARFSLCCPSGDRFRYDNYFGHGKLQMIRALIDGEFNQEYPPAEPLKPIFKPSEKFLHAVYTCTECGACEAQCKVQKLLEPMHATVALRQWLVERGIGPLPEHQVLLKSMVDYDNPWLGPRPARTRWIPRDLRGTIKNISPKNPKKEKAPLLYYVGCTSAYIPEVQSMAVATVRNLQAAGVDFGILGNDEVCCGSTMLRIGDRKGFEKFRDRNIATFKELGVETIITSCAGCTSTFKEEYADLLPGIEILHSTEYLERLISQGKLPIKNKVDLEVTYHDPCHIGRYCGIYDPPRNILKSIPGLKLTEMERIREDSYCCGEGGGVRTAFPEVASWVATERLEEARITTGSNVLVSACPFCEHNFKQVSGEKGFKIVDVNELVLQAL